MAPSRVLVKAATASRASVAAAAASTPGLLMRSCSTYASVPWARSSEKLAARSSSAVRNLLGVVDVDVGALQLVVKVGEQLELDHGLVAAALNGLPPPHSLGVDAEVGVLQRNLQPPGVLRPAGKLHVDLNVDVRRSRVQTPAAPILRKS